MTGLEAGVILGLGLMALLGWLDWVGAKYPKRPEFPPDPVQRYRDNAPSN